MSPIVSVVIHSYNRFDYLQNALKSVHEQTLQDFEIILVNDESTDEAKEFAYTLHGAIMSQAQEIGIQEEVADYQQSHLNSIIKGDPEPGFGRVDLEGLQLDLRRSNSDQIYRGLLSPISNWASFSG